MTGIKDTAVVTTYYNPKNYRSRLRNYLQFVKNLQRQNISLITVECSINNKFQVKNYESSSNVVITVKSQSEIWHKEHLQNVGIEYAKKQGQYKKIIFLDCDVIFLDDLWLHKASELLDKHLVIQPYSDVVRDSKEGLGITDQVSAMNVPEGHGDGLRMYSFISGYKKKKDKDREGEYGFAWGARLELFDNLKMYTGFILGGGDFLLRNCWTNNEEKFKKRYAWIAQQFSPELIADFTEYHKKMYSRINEDCGYLEGAILHLYHGSIKDRHYVTRYEIIKKYGYRPKEDLTINLAGGLEFIGNPELGLAISEYFTRRKEDDKIYRVPFSVRFHHFIDHKIGLMGKLLFKMTPGLYKRLKPYFPDKKSY